jgi:hypothetical protein
LDTGICTNYTIWTRVLVNYLKNQTLRVLFTTKSTI